MGKIYFDYDGMLQLLYEMYEICNKMLEDVENMQNAVNVIKKSEYWAGDASNYYFEKINQIKNIENTLQYNLSNAIQYLVVVCENQLYLEQQIAKASAKISHRDLYSQDVRELN